MLMRKLSIIIADDHTIFRTGLKRYMGKIYLAGTIEEASNGKEVLELLAFSSYDLVLLDIEMPVLNGIETLERIREKYSSVKVIMLSSFSSEGQIEELYKRKIDGYLLKNADLSELRRALTNIAEGKQYFCQDVANKLFTRILPAHEEKRMADSILTEREKEILLLLCEQYSSEEIAKKLSLSPRTIDRFRENLLLKTESRNSVGLALFAVRTGIKKI
jgi:DNA-binding NarL/FixJ family response regulator